MFPVRCWLKVFSSVAFLLSYWYAYSSLVSQNTFYLQCCSRGQEETVFRCWFICMWTILSDSTKYAWYWRWFGEYFYLPHFELNIAVYSIIICACNWYRLSHADDLWTEVGSTRQLLILNSVWFFVYEMQTCQVLYIWCETHAFEVWLMLSSQWLKSHTFASTAVMFISSCLSHLCLCHVPKNS